MRKIYALTALLALLVVSPVVNATTMHGGWGCILESDCQKIMGFIQNDNLAAYQAELTAELASGAATNFNDPETVIVDSHDGIYVEVHRKGDAQTYWVISDYVSE